MIPCLTNKHYCPKCEKLIRDHEKHVCEEGIRYCVFCQKATPDPVPAEIATLRARLAECEDNLKSMVEQYCRGHNFNQNDPSKYEYAHEFMSAGECTFEYLVKYGFAEYLENGVDIRLKPLEEK